MFLMLQVSNVVHFENFIRSWAADVLELLTQQSECPQSGNHILRQCIKALTVCISHGFLHNSGECMGLLLPY